MLQANQDPQIMKESRTKESYSGTHVKPVERYIHVTGKSGAWKTWHGIPHACGKGGGNKGGGYISEYVTGIDHYKTVER